QRDRLRDESKPRLVVALGDARQATPLAHGATPPRTIVRRFSQPSPAPYRRDPAPHQSDRRVRKPAQVDQGSTFRDTLILSPSNRPILFGRVSGPRAFRHGWPSRNRA